MDDADKLQLLGKSKRKRTVIRTAVTNLIKKIEAALALDNTLINFDEVEELIAQLKIKEKDIREVDNCVEDLIEDLTELQAELESAQEYTDKITIWKFRAEKRLKENVKESSVISRDSGVQHSDVGTCDKSIMGIRVPKLTINTYDGDICKFQDFFNTFNSAIHENKSLSNTQKFNYLKSYCTGLAADAIAGFSISDETYLEALELLKFRFGRKDLIISAHMKKLINMKPVYKSYDIVSLRKLYDNIEIQIRSLKALGISTDTYGNLLCPILLKVIPNDLSLEFTRQNPTEESFKVDKLLDYLKCELQARERNKQLQCEFLDSSPSTSDVRRVQSSTARDRNSVKDTRCRTIAQLNVKGAEVEYSDRKGCIFCKQDHVEEFCGELSVDQKKEKIKNMGLCYLCLRGHKIATCRLKKLCKYCKKRHHETICYTQFKTKDVDKESSPKDNVVTAKVSIDLYSNLNRFAQRKKSDEVIDTLPTIKVECGERILKGIIDTGSQISTVHERCVPDNYKDPCGRITLQSAFGQKLVVPLVNLPLAKCGAEGDSKIYPSVITTCAMVKELVGDLLLSLSAYNDLVEEEDSNNSHTAIEPNCLEKLQKVENDVRGKGSKMEERMVDTIKNNCIGEESHMIGMKDIKAEINANIVMKDELGEIRAKDKGGIDKENIEGNSEGHFSDSRKFMLQQKEDISLKDCWIDAKKKSNNYVIVDEMLYHKDKILGEAVCQLVVPQARRKQVLQLAHNSLWGGHLRKKKTSERIKYSFYWPHMKIDIDEFCDNCESCQLQAKKNQYDNVPITPVTRPDEPFQVINLDIIGPIEPNSRGYKYVLCAIDQCTRWPEAVCLKNISARATCEALLQIFCRTGIPKIIATDQGTNFTSALTQEFYERIGASPRFSTPGYPQANGLVERWNAVLKSMIHHTMRENSKGWDQYIPYLLWAYREVPNATTNVSPFQMLYGRHPTGPLSILKTSWSNETPIPIGQLNSVSDYLNDLKTKLEHAAEHAGLASAEKQKSYAFYHNRKARHKQFEEGDKVVVLVPDSNYKIYARWTAPATIIKRKSPYSYIVQLPDNSVRHVHANKIRAYRAKISNVGVIYESDLDFGDIESTPQVPIQEAKDFERLIEKVNLDNLDTTKRSQLLKMLKKYPSLYSKTPKIAHVGQHKIKLIPGSIPKKQQPYRIPETLKIEVDRQIEELLRLGFIAQSESEYAHPLVCVAKHDGSVRLCVDFRYLNAQTEPDAFPMINVTELIYKVSKAKFITLLDLLKGYWQIKMDPDCQHLTSFVTHRGQYAFCVMPFGLRNAAATFQRTMNQLLTRHKEYSDTYIDDVVIFSNDWNSHVRHVDGVLRTLNQANFTVNVEKCCFAQKEIKFLGHIVGSGKHSPDPEKVEAIQNLEVPKTKKDVRSVLGLLSYYREYVPDFASIARPLTLLTIRKAPSKIVWETQHDIAFQKLKSSICNSPKCYAPDFTRPFIIYADASAYAIAACLAQVGEDKLEHPVAFISKKLSQTQEKYATIEKEAYAVIFALKKFETYIYNAKVQVVSDHNPLTFLKDCAPQSARLQRWALALQRFHAQITYRKGKEHVNADSLSRLKASHWT